MPRAAQLVSGRTNIHSNWHWKPSKWAPEFGPDPGLPSQCFSCRVTLSWTEAVTSVFSWLKAADSTPNMPVLSFHPVASARTSWHRALFQHFMHRHMVLTTCPSDWQQKAPGYATHIGRTHCPVWQGSSECLPNVTCSRITWDARWGADHRTPPRPTQSAS